MQIGTDSVLVVTVGMTATVVGPFAGLFPMLRDGQLSDLIKSKLNYFLAAALGVSMSRLIRWSRRLSDRQARRSVRPAILMLEDRSVPATFTASIDPAVDNTGAVNQLVSFINKANATNEPDTIVLWPNATYTFAAAVDTNDGANALPSIIQDGAGKNPITIQGNGATFFRDSANSNKFRFLRIFGNNAALNVTDLTFKGGHAVGTSATGSGGAILATSNSTLNVSDSTFTGNTSATDGGAVAVLNGSNGSASTFTRTVFSGNTAGGTGGAAIATSFGFSSFVDSTIAANTATGGVGGVAGNGFLVFDFLRTNFTGNTGTSSGAFEGAEATFSHVTVDGNVATSGGTGGLNAGLANIYVASSTISHNEGKNATASGGGINGNKVVVVNSTIHANKSGGGGGIAGRDINVLYSTITNNVSTFGIVSPGGIQGTFSTTPIVLSHSVVAGNTSTAGSADILDISGTTVTSNGFNFIGIKPAAVTLLATDISGTSASPANPQLGPLQNNGGLTLSRAPLAGSPLINKGASTVVAPVTTDQRGYPRLVGAKADIGAFEVQTTNGVGIVAGNLQNARIAGGFSTKLQVIVTDPNGTAVAGQKVSFAGPTFGPGPEFSGFGTSGHATTNTSGIASIPVQANLNPGVYLVNAGIAGLPAVPFTLRNTNFELSPPPTSGIVAGSTGSGQSTIVTNSFTDALTITLTSSGNPVANYPVTFTTAVTAAASGTFTNGGTTYTLLTDATGTASTTVQSNTKSGDFTVTATALGYGIATYTLSNIAGDIVTLKALSGSGQATFLNNAFSFPLVGQAFDAYGNPSPGRTITFTTPGAGASATFPSNKAVTDPAGTYSSQIPTANGIGGSYTMTASNGAATADYTLTNLAPPPPPPAPNTNPVITGIPTQTTTTGLSVGPVTFAVVDLESPANKLTVSAASDNTTLVPVSGVILSGTGNSRNVTIQPQPGQTGSAKITLTVFDEGGLTGTTTFTVNVNSPTLTPPTVSGIANQTVATGGTAGPLNFTIGDAQTPATSLSVTATAANGVLFPAGSLVITGSGADRRISLTPAIGQTGSSLITIAVTDSDSMTTNSTFTVTVTPPPATPPSISDIADQTVTMNTTGGPYSFIVTDAITPAASLTVTAKSSNTTLLPNAKVVLGGSGNFRTVTVTPATGQSGTAVVTIQVTNAASQTTTETFTVTVPTIVPPPAAQGFFAGTGEGVPAVVNAFGPDGKLRLVIQPFDPTFTGGARVAVGDFNADGTNDVAVGSGPGIATVVRIFSGVDGSRLAEINPFESSFVGGVFVAAGDITGDGKADLVVTPDQGGSSRTIVYNAGNPDKVIANFFGIEDTRFRGGARAAVGDLNNDGRADIIISAGFGGGPRIAGYDGANLGINGGPKLFSDFFAFSPTLFNGIYVATGDINGDGFSDLIAGAGPGGGPRVTVFSGKGLVTSTGGTLADFFAGPDNLRDGVRVAAINYDSDSKLDILTGNGGGSSTIRLYFGKNTLAGTPNPDLIMNAFDGGLGGVFVG